MNSNELLVVNDDDNNDLWNISLAGRQSDGGKR
jgi:hypothetical protein